MADDTYALLSNYQQAIAEMQHLGEQWLDRKAAGADTKPVEQALNEVERESRRYERKLRKRGVDASRA